MKTNGTTSAWRFPTFRLLGVTVAVLSSFVAFECWKTPLRAFYLPTYARLSVLPSASRMHWSIGRGLLPPASFPIVFVGNTVATESLWRHLTGVHSVRSLPLESQAFYAWLKENIYGRQFLIGALSPVLYVAETALAVFFPLGWYFDRRQKAKARTGQILRGPGIVSRWKFNRRTKGDGIGFLLKNRRNLFEWLMPGHSGKYLRIRRDREAHHIQIAGVTGSGKSTVIRQILYQVEARENEVAIIFDPDREYVKEFYRPERGDWVLNPLDERCPYWAIEREAKTQAEATSIALSLWPDEPNQQPFFKKHPRAIFAYLIWRFNAFHCPDDPATCTSLARWLANPRFEITPRLTGTRHAVSTDANARDQSQGLWATLGEAATPLEMMPSDPEGRRIWTVHDWAQHRKGWIFITSTPTTLDALRPLQSLWLDMLILQLQATEREPGQARVWTIFDELASLNALPQLHSALTKQRKSDNPVVLGFQGIAQLEQSYGAKIAEVITSQAFSNFILRTREPRATEHLSNFIGKVQLERLRETAPSRLLEWNRGSYSTERVIDPLVMSSEIAELEDLTGYFVQKDQIVPIELSLIPKREIAPALIERVLPTPEPIPVVTPAAAAPGQANVSRQVQTAKQQVLSAAETGPAITFQP